MAPGILPPYPCLHVPFVRVVPGLSKAQRTFSKNLIDFKFETIGDQQTDDEIVIGRWAQGRHCGGRHRGVTMGGVGVLHPPMVTPLGGQFVLALSNELQPELITKRRRLRNTFVMYEIRYEVLLFYYGMWVMEGDSLCM